MLETKLPGGDKMMRSEETTDISLDMLKQDGKMERVKIHCGDPSMRQLGKVGGGWCWLIQKVGKRSESHFQTLTTST